MNKLDVDEFCTSVPALIPLYLFVLQADLPSPHCIVQTKLVNQILPSRSTSILAPQVVHQFLSLVHHHSQVPFVTLVFFVQVVGENADSESTSCRISPGTCI